MLKMYATRYHSQASTASRPGIMFSLFLAVALLSLSNTARPS